jgi:hypothetical protein
MALPVNTLLVEDCAAALGRDGWQYTQRQLYYATCARAETPASNAVSTGEVGLGVIFILVGLILIGVKVAFVLFVTLGVAMVLAGILGRLRRPTLTGRLLALSFDEFRSRFGALTPAGLIASDAALPATGGADAGVTIVCDTQDTAALVAANLERAEIAGTRVLAAGSTDQPAADTRVIVLHDASPRGCALVLDLRDSGVDAEDAGLRPRDVDGPNSQVIEGAPARLPRDLSALLVPAEVDWLLSGRRVELATLAPEIAMDRVRAAISQPSHPRDDAQLTAH